MKLAIADTEERIIVVKSKRAYIALGSNLDNPEQQVAAAIDELKLLPCCQFVVASSLYDTKPVGYADQPNFINAVLALDTSLTAIELLKQLQRIENQHARERGAIHFGPRTLDLDLLL